MTIHYPIGIGADQVPLNAMLSELARMPLEDLQAFFSAGISSRLQALGLGTYRDLRGTVYERGAPQDIYGSGMTVGLVRGGPDGLSIPVLGSGNNLYGVLIASSQWNDASGGLGMARIFVRAGRTFTQAFSSAAAWGPWVESFTTQNAVGVVAQSGGTITGAIIERGSNSNGEYTRFADGTQECWTTVSAGSVNSGTVYGWTFAFPAAFSVPPVLLPSIKSPWAYKQVIGTEGITLTAANGTAINNHSAAVEMGLFLFAKGRWY